MKFSITTDLCGRAAVAVFEDDKVYAYRNEIVNTDDGPRVYVYKTRRSNSFVSIAAIYFNVLCIEYE